MELGNIRVLERERDRKGMETEIEGEGNRGVRKKRDTRLLGMGESVWGLGHFFMCDR